MLPDAGKITVWLKRQKRERGLEKKLDRAGGPVKGGRRRVLSPPPPKHLAKPLPSRDHSFPGQLVFSHPPQAWPQAIDSLRRDVYPGKISADAILIKL